MTALGFDFIASTICKISASSSDESLTSFEINPDRNASSALIGNPKHNQRIMFLSMSVYKRPVVSGTNF
jgi:hypothetical protein